MAILDAGGNDKLAEFCKAAGITARGVERYCDSRMPIYHHILRDGGLQATLNDRRLFETEEGREYFFGWVMQGSDWHITLPNRIRRVLLTAFLCCRRLQGCAVDKVIRHKLAQCIAYADQREKRRGCEERNVK